MEHDLTMKVSTPITLGNTDVEIAVRVDGNLLGTLKLSKGTIDWKGKGRHSEKKLSWGQFAELISAEGIATPKRTRTPRTVTAAPSRAQKVTSTPSAKTAPAKSVPARKAAVKKTATRASSTTRSRTSQG